LVLPEGVTEGEEGTGNTWARSEDPIHSQYALPHEPSGYEVNVTTSPDVGETRSHFTPRDIVWSRATTHPIGEGALARMVDEIQSDRHQRAAQKWEEQGISTRSRVPTLMTPEQLEDWNNLKHAADLSSAGYSEAAVAGEDEANTADKIWTNR